VLRAACSLNLTNMCIVASHGVDYVRRFSQPELNSQSRVETLSNNGVPVNGSPARTRVFPRARIMTDTTSAAVAASPPEPAVYDPVLRALHWITAGVFLVALAIGVYASTQAAGTSPRRELLEVHKSLGMTVLFLTLARLAWRARSRQPHTPAAFGWLVRMASSANHWGLYALMLAMPLSGYVNSAAGGYSLKYFWLFSLPRLVPDSKALSLLGEEMHSFIAWIVYLTVTLHVAAVLWHELVKRDGTLSRMWVR
jgi:cytochrome b561